MRAGLVFVSLVSFLAVSGFAAEPWKEIAPLFAPPAEFANDFGKYRSLLIFKNGEAARSAADWAKRRSEIRKEWEDEIGKWPALIEKPEVEVLSSTNRE